MNLNSCSYDIQTIRGKMYRQIEEKLCDWKNGASGKPLIVIGARQVGKTYSIEAFGQRHYARLIELNLQDDVAARSFFEVPRSSVDIITYVEVNFPEFIDKKDTLLFFDEIQLCPELITSLKFLSRELTCDIICSGSMLGVKLHETSSWPVGYVETLTMYPMGFTEFVMANEIGTKHLDTIRECVAEIKPVPEALHDRFNKLFTDYMVCGGLPEAVNNYTEGGIAGAIRVNRRLANDYRIDIAHYADGKTKVKAQECFDSIPNQLAKENKKFQYNVVKKGYNARHYDESLAWLEMAGLVIRTNRLSRIERPLKSARELGVFKIYMFDTGILAGQFSNGDITQFIQGNMGMYKGMLYENVVAQMLCKTGKDAYYYEPNTSSEIDFVIEDGMEIVPIEIKGGLHVRSKSFDNFIKNHSVKKAYRFSYKNVGISGDGVTKYIPLYALEIILKYCLVDGLIGAGI